MLHCCTSDCLHASTTFSCPSRARAKQASSLRPANSLCYSMAQEEQHSGNSRPLLSRPAVRFFSAFSMKVPSAALMVPVALYSTCPETHESMRTNEKSGSSDLKTLPDSGVRSLSLSPSLSLFHSSLSSARRASSTTDFSWSLKLCNLPITSCSPNGARAASVPPRPGWRCSLVLPTPVEDEASPASIGPARCSQHHRSYTTPPVQVIVRKRSMMVVRTKASHRSC